ncbi:hypothetical protein [Terasakiella pusilla]|uniref:hypothetical protein n=1 Tax=Terasakiella pusilla TaxID=64973 RepID=UPI003AA8E58A
MAHKLTLQELPDWPLLMTIEEASRYVGISVNLFRTLNPVQKIYISEKSVRYHREDLKAWVQVLKHGAPITSNDAIIKGMFN